MDILLYTKNPGKIIEFQFLFADLPLQIRTPETLGVDTGVAETGRSFVENALIKARDGAQQIDGACIADDSGLMVDCLRGAPGIYSSRYAGEGASDHENCEKLLQRLADIPPKRRTARFHCTLAFLRHADDPCPLLAQGTMEGHIHLQSSGKNGFGYDPIFWPIGKNCSVSELSTEDKHAISHRGQALRQLQHLLNTEMSQSMR